MSVSSSGNKGLAAQRLHAVLVSVVGTTSMSIIVGMVVYLLVFDLFQETISGVIAECFFAGDVVNTAKKWVGLSVFPTITFFGIHIARSRRLNFSAQTHTRSWSPEGKQVSEVIIPEKARALIMFLSFKGKEKEADCIDRMIAGEFQIGFEEGTYQHKKLIGDASWRIALDAIRYHRPTLERIVVIPSSGERGTCKVAGDFKKLVKRAIGDDKFNIDVLDSCAGGIDYEDLEQIVGAVELANLTLLEKGFSENEILVDITSGQKVASVAGAIVALGEGRRFQYVSTTDYSVKTYDVEYRVIDQ